MSRRSVPALASLLTLPMALAACIVVPVDPRTGQPYPAHAPSTSPVTVIAPQQPQPQVVNVRLYPLNVQASRNGVLNATVIDQRGGHGRFSVNYAGETLQGEATRVDASGRGVANAFGPGGSSAQCEYAFSAPGRGTGICRFSDGAHYQMHIGM